MKPLVLVADIGNTSTSYGLYRGGKITRQQRFDTALTSVALIKKALRGLGRVDGVCIASVVPEANTHWRRAVGKKILWIDHRKKMGIGISYPKPKTIGADRLANAAGGVVRYGSPLIVADFGTAVTFDVITTDAGYVGGVIAPGLPLMFTYLAEKTAKLPAIGPAPVGGGAGRSTEEAMRRGAVWGYRGMVREIVAELRKVPALRNAKLCATGGYAKWVVKGLKPAMTIDQDLTLFGAGKIFELNAHLI